MRRNLTPLFLMLFALSISAAATAAPFSLLDSAGKVIGIEQLDIGGRVYDVTFSSGGLSYADALASVNGSDWPTFNSVDEATDAATAIGEYFNTANRDML